MEVGNDSPTAVEIFPGDTIACVGERDKTDNGEGTPAGHRFQAQEPREGQVMRGTLHFCPFGAATCCCAKMPEHV
jgi:hypothetical protein